MENCAAKQLCFSRISLSCWCIGCVTHLEVHKLSESGGGLDGGGGGSKGPPPPEGGTISRTSSTRSSLRKVLPPVPDFDQQLSMASKMIDQRTSTPKGNHAYTPHFFESLLLAEYHLLQKERVQGVYVIPSARSPLVWFGVVFVRQGDYEEGVFRFTLHIPENFPDGPVPRILFETPVFHPLVSPDTGEMDVGRGFSYKWRRCSNHLFHLLLYMRRAFHKIETSKPLNPEAAVLYESDFELFQRRVRACVSQSLQSVHDPPAAAEHDPHAIIFSQYNPLVHEPIRKQLKTQRPVKTSSEESIGVGLSWIKQDSLHIFSQQPATS
ncbi:Ubiquitin-conjugating enzyme E2 [Trinorchestia longiramus]|nr:Ubiquitin-conjugating enzyme E2 [Trinorchestia longiramus]